MQAGSTKKVYKTEGIQTKYIWRWRITYQWEEEFDGFERGSVLLADQKKYEVEKGFS